MTSKIACFALPLLAGISAWGSVPLLNNAERSSWIEKYAYITVRMLYDTRTNIYVGAWVLSKCVAKHGMTRNGITCYNGRIKDNPYADKILNAFYRQESRYALR